MNDSSNSLIESISILKVVPFLFAFTVFFGHHINAFALTFVVIALFAITMIQNKLQIFKKDFYFLFLVFAWAISSAYSTAQVRGIEYSIMLGAMFLLMLFMQNTGYSKKYQKWLFFFSGIHVVATLLYLIVPDVIEEICKIIMSDSLYASRVSFFSRYNIGNPGITTQTGWNIYFIAVFIIIAGIEYFFEKKTRFLFLMLIGVVAGITTLKRGVLIATVIALFIVILLISKENRNTIIKFSLIGVIAVVAVLYLSASVPYIQSFIGKISFSSEKGVNTFSSGRIHIYLNALGMMNLRSFFFGFGTASVDDLLGTAAHNIYIQVLFENGIFALISFLAFCIESLCTTIKCAHNMSKEIMISLALQIMFLIYGFFGNPLYDMQMLMVYVFAVAYPYMEIIYSNNEI